MVTEGKIVSFLSIGPFTYQQLWKVSSIHRNILRKRLDSLVERKIIFEHKYSIPYDSEFYGSAHDYPISYWSPLFGRIYYLLNCSRPECDKLAHIYFRYMSSKDNKRKKDISKILPSFTFLDKISDRQLGKILRKRQRTGIPFFKINKKVFEIFFLGNLDTYVKLT